MLESGQRSNDQGAAIRKTEQRRKVRINNSVEEKKRRPS